MKPLRQDEPAEFSGLPLNPKTTTQDLSAVARPAHWFWSRWLYLLAGFVCLGLATAGAVLPVLPCTPFVLLAVYCFSRSSKRLHHWLLRSRIFGPIIADWQNHRAIRRRVRFNSVLLIIVVVGLTFAFVRPPLWLAITILGLVSLGLLVIFRLPVYD